MGSAGPAQLCIVALVKMQIVLQTIKYIALIGAGEESSVLDTRSPDRRKMFRNFST